MWILIFSVGSFIFPNITAAWAVDREFEYIVGPIGPPLVAFGSTLAYFWTFGMSVASLWLPLGGLGLPLVIIWVPSGCRWPSLGAPLAILGLPGRLRLNLGSMRGPQVDFLIDVRSGIIG